MSCTRRAAGPRFRRNDCSSEFADRPLLGAFETNRLFGERLDYNVLFRWFLGMNLEGHGLDQSNFSRLRERLVESKVAVRFFDAVVREARR